MDKLSSCESRFPRGCCKTVPWTYRGAVVTPVDAVADEWTEFFRNRTFEFDGEIRNAAACVQMVRGRDGCRRADVDASAAAAAAVFRGFVGFQFEGGEGDAEKKEGAELARDEHCTLSMPSDSRERGIVPLQHGACVHVAALSAPK